MDEVEVFGEGQWCENCEFFEDVDIFEDREGNPNRCPACGCSRDAHHHVKIVAKGSS